MWYAKIFEKFFLSSIMEEDLVTRYVFICFCVKADAESMVYGTRERLAMLFGVPQEDFDRAIDRLTRPDPNSSSQEHEGRRLIEMGPNAWFVVNARAYRKLSSAEEERLKARERMRRLREERAEAEGGAEEENVQDVRDVRHVRNVRDVRDVRNVRKVMHKIRVRVKEDNSNSSNSVGYDNPSGLSVSHQPTPEERQPKVLLTFPCRGAQPEYHLTEDILAELQQLFPEVDCWKEARKALAWVMGNQDRKKTARGMRRFLFSWISRAVDGGFASPRSTNGESLASRLLPPMEDEEAENDKG